ncbi:unnamed protein product [Rhizophagus irregularis]|nr:unnamed protein product [Rhizophagus irregularis]
MLLSNLENKVEGVLKKIIFLYQYSRIERSFSHDLKTHMNAFNNTLITLTFILKRKAYFETNYIKYYLTSFLSE